MVVLKPYRPDFSIHSRCPVDQRSGSLRDNRQDRRLRKPRDHRSDRQGCDCPRPVAKQLTQPRQAHPGLRLLDTSSAVALSLATVAPCRSGASPHFARRDATLPRSVSRPTS